MEATFKEKLAIAKKAQTTAPLLGGGRARESATSAGAAGGSDDFVDRYLKAVDLFSFIDIDSTGELAKSDLIDFLRFCDMNIVDVTEALGLDKHTNTTVSKVAFFEMACKADHPIHTALINWLTPNKKNTHEENDELERRVNFARRFKANRAKGAKTIARSAGLAKAAAFVDHERPTKSTAVGGGLVLSTKDPRVARLSTQVLQHSFHPYANAGKPGKGGKGGACANGNERCARSTKWEDRCADLEKAREAFEASGADCNIPNAQEFCNCCIFQVHLEKLRSIVQVVENESPSARQLWEIGLAKDLKAANLAKSIQIVPIEHVMEAPKKVKNVDRFTPAVKENGAVDFFNKHKAKKGDSGVASYLKKQFKEKGLPTNNKVEAEAAKAEQEAQAKAYANQSHGQGTEEAQAKVMKRRNSMSSRTEAKCTNCERGFYLAGDVCEFASCAHTKGTAVTNEAMPGYGT